MISHLLKYMLINTLILIRLIYIHSVFLTFALITLGALTLHMFYKAFKTGIKILNQIFIA